MTKWFILACALAAVWMYCQIWIAWSAVQLNISETIYYDNLNGWDKDPMRGIEH